MTKEYYVYRYKDRFVIMDVKLPLITEQPAFTGTEKECEKWVEEAKQILIEELSKEVKK